MVPSWWLTSGPITVANDTVDGFLLRKAFEQLVFQQSNFHELGRSAALFEQTAPPRALKVIQPGWDQQLFGCSLSQYVSGLASSSTLLPSRIKDDSHHSGSMTPPVTSRSQPGHS